MKYKQHKTRMSNEVKAGVYRHYKGKLYQVLGCARHSETEEMVVVYRTLYGGHSLWVRPLAMFCENFVVDGKKIARFKFVGESAEME